MPSHALATIAPPLLHGPRWAELVPVGTALPLASSVMACIGFGTGPEASADPRYVHVGMPLLAPAPRLELWHSQQRVDFGRDGTIGFAQDGEIVFGHLYVLECELGDMAAATFRAYAQITTFLARHGYPQLLRCWNYLHGINHGNDDRERYKQFCVGRYQALVTSPGFECQLPAGTAIGMPQTGMVIYFIAAKEPGVKVENPRQTPAVQYPRQYGPRSPSFSRATLTRWGGAAQLLVSGTAAVVGHATQHVGNCVAQLDETFANLDALLQHAAVAHLDRPDGACWSAQTLKLYLRDRADLDPVRRRVEQTLGSGAPVLYLEGDICRTDLAVEIEGMYGAPGLTG